VLGRSKSGTRKVPARTGNQSWKRLKKFTTAGNIPKNQLGLTHLDSRKI
jgi:hypothetical protein